MEAQSFGSNKLAVLVYKSLVVHSIHRCVTIETCHSISTTMLLGKSKEIERCLVTGVGKNLEAAS